METKKFSYTEENLIGGVEMFLTLTSFNILVFSFYYSTLSSLHQIIGVTIFMIMELLICYWSFSITKQWKEIVIEVDDNYIKKLEDTLVKPGLIIRKSQYQES